MKYRGTGIADGAYALALTPAPGPHKRQHQLPHYGRNPPQSQGAQGA